MHWLSISLAGLILGPLTALSALFGFHAQGRLSANPPGATSTPLSAVTIYSISPAAGPVGTTISLDGFGFTDDNTIYLTPAAGGMSGVVPHVASSGGRALMCAQGATNCHPGVHQILSFTMPAALEPGCAFGPVRCMIAAQQTQPGTYTIRVENSNGQSRSVQFAVTAN